jgi:magnesium chelatase subunit I
MAKAKTLGELRQSGYRSQGVREEMRRNLVGMLRERKPIYPEMVGYDETVVPDLVNAILSRHDFILLGLRGQGKTRILRGLTRFLDAEIPEVAGCEIHDDPFAPVCGPCRARLAEEGDALPIGWIPREARYHEKLATPDVTIADLIGDVDPIKAATRKLALSDEGVIHYGIIPRANRGIFAVNELPDLQPRIQVGLLNILQEQDIQIRGFPIRLPLDILLVFSANPEDYTNRGNIITPLKDRIHSQILTHYPESVEEALAITGQESWTKREGDGEILIPEFVREVVEEIAFAARESEYVDQSSGVSARLAISAIENVVSNVERRTFLTGDKQRVARVCDVQAAVPSVTGKIELVYEGEKEGTLRVAKHLIGQAVLRVFMRHFPAAAFEEGDERAEREQAVPGPYRPILEWFGGGKTIELSDMLANEEYFKRLNAVPGLAELAGKHLEVKEPHLLAPAMELVLEALHQASRLAKEELAGRVAYTDMLQKMFSGFGDAAN